MNRHEVQQLQSERSALQTLLNETPVEDVLDRGSIQSRLNEVNQRLAQAPVDSRLPARTRLTFRGKPVVGSHGIFAEFGAKATQLFTDTVSKVAAGLEGPLANKGPIPNKAQNQLLITSTALGSFGFELEEFREEAMLIDDGSVVADALVATLALLEATVGDDDSLADAAAGMEERAITAARTFLQLLADNEAVCAMDLGGKRFGFSDVGQVRRSLSRLATNNLFEGTVSRAGEFQGVLPKSRNFEFKLSETGEVIKGKIGPGIADPGALNTMLHKPMTITFAETRVGTGKPRFTLNTMPQT
jgi:hypothetical protein